MSDFNFEEAFGEIDPELNEILNGISDGSGPGELSDWIEELRAEAERALRGETEDTEKGAEDIVEEVLDFMSEHGQTTITVQGRYSEEKGGFDDDARFELVLDGQLTRLLTNLISGATQTLQKAIQVSQVMNPEFEPPWSEEEIGKMITLCMLLAGVGTRRLSQVTPLEEEA